MKPASRFLAEAKALIKSGNTHSAIDTIADGLQLYPKNKALNALLMLII